MLHHNVVLVLQVRFAGGREPHEVSDVLTQGVSAVVLGLGTLGDECGVLALECILLMTHIEEVSPGLCVYDSFDNIEFETNDIYIVFHIKFINSPNWSGFRMESGGFAYPYDSNTVSYRKTKKPYDRDRALLLKMFSELGPHLETVVDFFLDSYTKWNTL